MATKPISTALEIACFPKIVWDKKCERFVDWKDERKVKLSKLLTSNFESAEGSSLEVHGEDWEHIVAEMKEGTLYWPAPLSSSGDAYYVYEKMSNKLGILGIQLRQTKIRAEDLVIEFLKAKPHKVSNCQFVFLCIAIQLGADIPKNVDLSDANYNKFKIIKDVDKNLAYHYEPGFRFANIGTANKKVQKVLQQKNIKFDPPNMLEWDVPKDSQIIVLVKDGLEKLFTERVYDLLTSRDAERYISNGAKRQRI